MTDHAAEAREALIAWEETVGEAWREQMLPAVAQVHATLALADEQRTANLIAALTAQIPTGGTPVALAEAYTSLRHEIAARLGLTPTTPNQEQ